MALRTIITDEDPFLRKKSRIVTHFDNRTKQLLDDLKDTMHEANGLGLAAPQVGVLRRVFVMLDGEELVEVINPEIVESQGEVIQREACLSCPDKMGVVRRPRKVLLRAQNRDGEVFERAFEEISARAVCHESDHLDGILFTDLIDESINLKEYLDSEEMESSRGDA